MHIELNRTFRELLRDEAKGDDARALSPGNATLTLQNLLNEPRVVILSEAGSGKTEEIREAARRLREEGKAAFFLRLEHVAVDFDTAFEEGTLQEFQAWLASAEQGWILLDSIDESRLRSPLEFANAIRRVSNQLVTVKQRTNLLITGRAPAWRPTTDLELCSKLFPVADENVAVPYFDDIETTNERKQTTANTAAHCFKIVALEDLSSEQVKHFAERKGISNTQAFLDAIERSDAWSFTARPQDLDELTGFWIDNGTIGSRLELMKNSISRRLKEPDQTRAEAQPLTNDRALEAAQIIAAALVLTCQQIIAVPDGARSSPGLKLEALLTTWASKEISTLLQRPLFAQDIYGAVRFHHRSVKEYLAAQWFLKLLGQEVSRRRIEELFFREQYDLEVIVPSLRPVLPWLAMDDNRILSRVRRVAPEIVFEGGDPVQLPTDVRISILEEVCAQLASGASTRSMADFAAIQRFAAPDLVDTLRQLIQKYQGNDYIVSFLIRMVWQGRLRDALPETMNVACTTTSGYASRIAAFRAVADLGSLEDMTLIREVFAEDSNTLDRKCMADLVSHIQQPSLETLHWLLRCLPRLTEYKEFEGTGLSEKIASFFERASLRLVAHGIEKLQELLSSPPVIEGRYSEVSERYQWLCRAAGVAIRCLINSRDAMALMPSSLAILHALQIYGQYNGRAFDLKRLGLAEAIHKWPELKWALFWHVVEQERKSKAEKNERLVDFWIALVSAPYVSFDNSDFNIALHAITERAHADDKLVALSLTFKLYLNSRRQRSRIAQLKKAVVDDNSLTECLATLMKPAKKPEELKRMERENAQWSRKAAIRRKREEQAQLEAPGKLEARLDKLRDPGFDDPSAISMDQHYLYNRMCGLEENKDGSGWSKYNWRPLEREFGDKTPRAFRDGMVRFWRTHSPELVSEGAALNSIPLRDLFGLAGLTIEAAENPELFSCLRPTLAAIAFRYAMRELNGFPPWFPALSNAHLEMVKSMALVEVISELQEDGEKAPSHYIISDLSNYADWLWDVIAPDIVKLLRTQPLKSSARLLHLVSIIQASKLPDSDIATLAATKFQRAGAHLPLWGAIWTGVDPSRGIDAVEAHLMTLEDAKARTEFIMRYISHLLGDQGISTSQARTKFHSPAMLRRLYVLVHEHVRSREDIDRAGKGVYSPGLRDNAQDARERLVGILSDIPGREAYLALKDISESHPEPTMRPWFALRARAKAEADSERPVWTGEQVRQFAKEFERTPTNHRELFDLAVLRLQDFKHEVENGDASTATVLINAKLETVVRNFIAAWCSKHALGRYVIPQEEELPDAKRPDLKWHCSSFKGPVPTELKIADKWTGPQLFERLDAQLAGDYLRDDASSRGIYLLINRGTQQRWQLPTGEYANFEELIAALQTHWKSVANTHAGIEEIKVIGVDLTKRTRAPMPKKRPDEKKTAKKDAARSSSKAPLKRK